MAFDLRCISLNILRVLSIISLMLVIATCMIVNVKGFPGLGQSNTLFQFMNRIVIAIWALVLILSEIGWPRRIYTWFPMLDETHSWTCFGLLQMIIGSLILGYDSGINSIDFLGYSLFEFIIVPGWFVFVIGIIYVFLGAFGGTSLKADRRITMSSEKTPPPSYTV
ncbi:9600_t:CDS:2 [Acaulospora morrowiae]|uniref:9600_t:CDS:1 n=1 Tax=Acaulospora morrowiae TaxID=94023 RepID=A0A9N9I3M9_9GLOM|nr:9600_t:CDS:2 [Acaulospora morrowiae]